MNRCDPIHILPVVADAITLDSEHLFLVIRGKGIEVRERGSWAIKHVIPGEFSRLASDKDNLITSSGPEALNYRKFDWEKNIEIDTHWEEISSINFGVSHSYFTGTAEIEDGDWRGYEYGVLSAWSSGWGEKTGEIKATSGAFVGVAIHDDLLFVARSQGEELLKRHDPVSLEVLETLPLESRGLNAIVDIPKTPFLGLLGWEHLYIYHPTAAKVIHSIDLSAESTGISLQADTDLLVASSFKGDIWCWGVGTWDLKQTCSGPGVRALDLALDGDFVVASYPEAGEVRIWDRRESI